MLTSELIQLCWAGNLLFLFIALGAGLVFKDSGCCEVLLAGAGAKPDVPVQWDSKAPSGKNLTGVSYTLNPHPPPHHGIAAAPAQSPWLLGLRIALGFASRNQLMGISTAAKLT